LTRVRPNWIFGVRTPWTLSSDRSWRESHRVAGYGFVVAGLAVLITSFAWPAATLVVTAVGVGGSALISVVWSYFAWKRDPNAQGREA
ncbi:MAG TPA: SdpI family protein, partial [Gemmatimonadales bacterium]